MYRLVPLLETYDPDVVSIAAEEHHIEGKLGQYVVVSVPESCNMARAEEIKAKVMALVKKPVVVFSHNISLLKASRLSSAEAAEVIRKGEEYAARIEANAQVVANDGDRSGLCESRNGGLGEDSSGQGAPVGGEGAGDKKGEQKDDAGSPGSGG